jgi:uncharacterized protein with PIN domain
MLVLMVMAALLRASYEMSRAKPNPSEEVSAFAETRPISETPKPVTSQQREWAEKAVKRYGEAQEKKWRNWNEAMFERG